MTARAVDYNSRPRPILRDETRGPPREGGRQIQPRWGRTTGRLEV